MNIIKQFKKLRKEQKLSQRDVARRSGLTQASISYIENEREDILLSTAQNVAEALGYKIALVKKD